jgi:putative nucleotidyltransferase with HDIG domain
MFSTKNSLMSKFAIYSFVAFVVTGIILVVVITMHIRADFSDYMPLLDFEKHLLEINRIIIAIVFLGLLTLYFLLNRIIHRASKTLVEQNQNLIQQNDELDDAYEKLHKTYKETVVTLSRAVDARDPYTAGHSERVAAISKNIAKKIGVSKKEFELIELAAQFHDIGKIGVPDSILLKPGKLTEMEFNVIKEHPVIGTNILCNIEFLKDSLPIILHHHETYDGRGYPYGISGAEIPLGSRIISIADTYDAMTSDRPYRKALLHEQAIQEIVRCKGTQFDAEIIETALDVLKNPLAD